MLRTFGTSLWLMLLLVPAASAQETPRIELFGGYSYLRSRFDAAPFANWHGWHVSTTANMNSWLGIRGDFSGHSDWSLFGRSDVSATSFLFGPQIASHKSAKWMPFLNVLVGITHARAKGSSSLGPLRSDETSFATALGGGVDYKSGRTFGLRLIQVDYFLTRFKEDNNTACLAQLNTPCPSPRTGTQNNLRLSFGFTMRIGGR